MFRYERAKILPYFLKQGMAVAELARRAGISHASAQRAVDGEKVAAPIIAKVADTLGIDAMEFLENGGKKMLSKKTVTIVKDDGTKKDVEISVDETGKMFAFWGEDDTAAQKAFAQYLSEKKSAEE